MFRQMSTMELSIRLPPELAQQLNCSLRHFRRLFREEFGMPFQVQQTEQRLLRARQLLVESEDTVIKIAGQCGYPHMSFFNSLFKRRFGMTPGEWRLQARKRLFPPTARLNG
jgi:AraC-like DNA-binding protein